MLFDMTAVMTVVVRDPAGEAEGGPPCLRIVTVSAFCPVCLERRGQPRTVCVTSGPRPYWLDVWSNPCGHPQNRAAAVLEEFATQCARPDCVLERSDTHYPYCSEECSIWPPALLDWFRLLRSYLHRTCPAAVQVPVVAEATSS